MKNNLLITGLLSTTLLLGACGNEVAEDHKEPKQEQKLGEKQLNDWVNEDSNNPNKEAEGQLSENFMLDVEINMLILEDVYTASMTIDEATTDEEVAVAIEDTRYEQDRYQNNIDIMPTRNKREKAVKEDFQKIADLTVSSTDKTEKGLAENNEELLASSEDDIEKAIKILENLDIE